MWVFKLLRLLVFIHNIAITILHRFSFCLYTSAFIGKNKTNERPNTFFLSFSYTRKFFYTIMAANQVVCVSVFTQSSKGRNTVVKNRIIHAKTDDTFEEILDAISNESSFELQPRISVCVQVAAGITDLPLVSSHCEILAFDINGYFSDYSV